ncbi:MAG: hypothetical protein ACFFCW_15385 [Candidatus Hodarchaeota archaeon]
MPPLVIIEYFIVWKQINQIFEKEADYGTQKKSEAPDQGERSGEKVCCTAQDGKTSKKISIKDLYGNYKNTF